MQQRERTHRVAGVAVVLARTDLVKLEWFGTGHVGIDEQHLIAIIQVGDVLDLKLHVVLAFDIVELHFRHACDQLGAERVVAAPGIAVSEQ